MDFRFMKGIREYLDAKGLTGDCDLVSVAGAAKNISNPSDPFEMPFVMKQIGLSHDLHHVKKVVLMNHLDCGAYGGTKAFTSPEDEKIKHMADLKAAGLAVKEKYPDVEVLLVLGRLNPDGSVAVEEVA
jgi:carbonic anhydrase